MTGSDYRRLLVCFVRLDLRTKYVGSALGVLWSVIQPLCLLAVYWFVFSAILKIRVPHGEGTRHYALFLFAGLVPWQAFQRGIMRGTVSLVENAGLIGKVAFPISILPVYLSISDLLSESVGFILLLAALMVWGPGLRGTVLLLPVLLLLQLLFTIGLGWIGACANAYFRDVSHTAGLLLTAWFFATPILYPLSKAEGAFHTLLMANPMTHLMEMYRAVLLRGERPSPASLGLFCAFTALAFFGGRALFRRNAKEIPDLV